MHDRFSEIDLILGEHANEIAKLRRKVDDLLKRIDNDTPKSYSNSSKVQLKSKSLARTSDDDK